jgi:hypothetical protein
VAMTLFTKRYKMKKCSDYSLSDYPDWIAGQHATCPSKLLQRAAHLLLKPASSCHATVRQSAYSPWTAWNPTSAAKEWHAHLASYILTASIDVLFEKQVTKWYHLQYIHIYIFQHIPMNIGCSELHNPVTEHLLTMSQLQAPARFAFGRKQLCAAIRLPSQGVCLVPI